MNQVTMAFRAYCLDCKRFHDVPELIPGTQLIKEMESWEYKHRGHRIEFNSKSRHIPRDTDDTTYKNLGRYLDFKENNNFQFAFVAAANLTFTSLDSLAYDNNLLAGANATYIDNGSTGCPLEIGISALIKNSGSAPTAGKEIDLWVVPAIDDTPTWPDAITGADGAVTMTTAAILQSSARQMASLQTANTASQVNPMASTGLKALIGVMPRYWTVFVVHNSGQALNASGHQVTYKGVYVQG